LGFAIDNPIEVIGKHCIEVFESTVTYNARFSEVRDIKESDSFANSCVLSEDSCAWIFDRHKPAPEIGHLRLEVYMLLMQR
jgi:hypothetical protein